MPSMPDIVAATDGMADAMKEKWLTTRWTRKSKQEGWRKKYSSVSLLLSRTSSRSCKMSNCIPQGCRWQMKCPRFLHWLHIWNSFQGTHFLSVGFLRKKGRQQHVEYVMPIHYEEDVTANLFLAQLVAIWSVKTGWNSSWSILEMFPINIFLWCKLNEWGWYFNKFKSKLFKMCLRKLGWAV